VVSLAELAAGVVAPAILQAALAALEAVAKLESIRSRVML
jgi:hypothetical protein